MAASSLTFSGCSPSSGWFRCHGCQEGFACLPSRPPRPVQPMGRPGVLQPEPEALHGIPRGTILRQGVQAQAGGGGPPGMDRLGRVAAAIGHAEPEGTVWIGDQPRLQDGEAIVGAPPLTDHLSPRPGPDMQRPQQGPRDSGARGGRRRCWPTPCPRARTTGRSCPRDAAADQIAAAGPAASTALASTPGLPAGAGSVLTGRVSRGRPPADPARAARPAAY